MAEVLAKLIPLHVFKYLTEEGWGDIPRMPNCAVRVKLRRDPPAEDFEGLQLLIADKLTDLTHEVLSRITSTESTHKQNTSVECMLAST